MTSTPHTCPNCGDITVPAEAALNRGWADVAMFGFGSSLLQIRPGDRESRG